MISWEELLKNRRSLVTVVNSLAMLDNVKKVTERYPNAKIEKVDKDSWRLVNNDEALSNPHNSHYACWQEAREVMNVADQSH